MSGQIKLTIGKGWICSDLSRMFSVFCLSIFLVAILLLIFTGAAHGQFANKEGAISAGSKHSVGLMSNSTALAWGRNNVGQLGDGSTADRHAPVPVKGLDGVCYIKDLAAVDAGGSFSLGLKKDGTVWAWGVSGRLGDGSSESRHTPVQVKGQEGDGYLTDIKKISAGRTHSLALKSDGTVWAWGINDDGQLGDGSTDTRYTPVQVKGLDGDGYLTDVVEISAGGHHSLALKDDGTVWAWGNNDFGQLGDGSSGGDADKLTPVQVSGLSGVVEISAGWYHSLALKDDGTVWAWGYNEFGQLGDGTTDSSDTPVQIPDLDGVVELVAGGHHSLALMDGGTVRAWGWNDKGQLGDGSTIDRHSPVLVKGAGGTGQLAEILTISCDYRHSMALKDDGTVWAWGINDVGQLGDGSTTDRHAPVQVSVIYDWIFSDFAADINSVPPQDPVQFTDISTGEPTGWAWYFGDEDFSDPWVEMAGQAGWTARSGHSGVALPDGSIVLIGGFDGNRKDDVWISRNEGVSWTLMSSSSLWSARNNHSSVVLPDGSIVLMGGWGGAESFFNDVWHSTNEGANWLEMTPSALWPGRDRHSSVVLPDGSIVLMGGQNESGLLNDVWRSEDKGATWTQMTANAQWFPRSRHSSVVLPDGSIVIMGGDNNNDVWRSTDKGANWTRMTASAQWTARSGHSSVSLPDGSIVLMGGSNNRRDVWRSSDKGATWTQVTNWAEWSGRDRHSSVVLPDGSIVLMGGQGINHRMNDVWLLETAGSTDQHPSHIYTDPGIYQVSLQANNDEDRHITSKAGYINVQNHILFYTNPEEGGAISGISTTDYYDHGSQLTATAIAYDPYTFISWTENGEVVSTSHEYTFKVTQDRDLWANFKIVGALKVIIEPPEAVDAGAQWRIKGTDTWYYSGETVADIPVEKYTVEFRTVPGWRPIESIEVEVVEREVSGYTGYYEEYVTALPGVLMLLLDDE